jgi:manganese efflux pump family protein
MHPLEIILLALGLAMDAFAVAVASGIAFKNFRVQHALRMALAFGLFQAVMPVIGWQVGRAMLQLVAGIDHWIVFALLAGIGGKMMVEAYRIEEAEEPTNPFGFAVLLVLALATSIDALAVGITFAMVKTAIVTPVVVIGSVTFVLSLAGVYIGEAVGHFFEKKIEIAGGLVLIGIGVKILIQHLCS